MTPINQYQVTAQLTNGAKGPMIELNQEDGSDHGTCAIYLHPWQIRSIMDQFGLIAADQEAAKKVATLERHLLLLRDRIETMFIDLCNNPGQRHVDMSGDMAYANATLDLAHEFCHDLDCAMTETVAAPDQKVTVAP